MLYQDPLDFPALKVRENFQLAGPPGGRKVAVRKLRQACESLGFDLDPEARVESLTVGERQQLEMLRQLEAGAAVLILDEPTTGITLKQKDKLFETLRSLKSEYDRTMVFVTHKLSEAMDLCDHIWVMRQGRLVAEFDPPYDEKDLVEVMFGPQAARSMRKATPCSRPGTKSWSGWRTAVLWVTNLPWKAWN